MNILRTLNNVLVLTEGIYFKNNDSGANDVEYKGISEGKVDVGNVRFNCHEGIYINKNFISGDQVQVLSSYSDRT